MAQIIMITPASRGSWTGNRVSATRWARRLRELGHRVAVKTRYGGESCDLLVALHARKSAAAIRAFHAAHPHRPIVVVLTGTDVYRDLRRSQAARRALGLATRIVLLQPLAARELPRRPRAKSVAILQSAQPVNRSRGRRCFEVLVLSHLRAVKDPLRAARAMRLLPASSRLHLVHAGGALEPAWARRARHEMRRNPRYRWRGEVTHAGARRLLARARVLVLASRLEGGANVVSEAIVSGVPVLASRIPGSVGLLGTGYPGYFEVGDTRGLADLLARIETDAAFEARLHRHLRRLAPRFTVERERAAWRRLLMPLLPSR